MLAGCAGSPALNSSLAPPPKLSEPPAHIKKCFAQTANIPVAQVEAAIRAGASQEKINAMARDFIVKLRRSEKAKTRCGQQLLAFYDRVKGNVGRKKAKR
jgi:hypothetical protein